MTDFVNRKELTFLNLRLLCRLLVALCCLLPAAASYAQTVDYKNTVQVGADYLGMPDNTGVRYLGQYARHMRQDRLVVAVGVGYSTIPNCRTLPATTYELQGRPIKRVTTDLTVAFDFLRNPRHALRLGVGPSAWYCEDARIDYARYTIRSDGTVTNVEVQWLPTEKVNFGFHVLTEYSYQLTKHLALGSRVGVVSLQNAGGLTGIAGLLVSHRL